MIGTTLAHYEIVGKLGQGGMGEVYRARDTRLGRDVALKLLPADVADDPERVARFEREARTLASLHHPNIASIFGFEEAGDRRFLTMELVEGEDLAERLTRGAVPVDTAVEIARQIAAGVEAAHVKGIVHRDLKPANVKITPDEQVKVLDFGLARAYLGTDSDTETLEHSPTITAGMTTAGTILGTAAYMSPEQARGKTVDWRTDLWSFGCILYEMLVGRRPFPGEVLSESLGAIIHKDPDWDLLPRTTPPGLRRLLVRCLTKDARQRLQSIGDARIELEQLDADGPQVPAEEPRRAGKSWPLIAGALAVGLALGAALAFVARSGSSTVSVDPQPVSARRLTLTLPADAPMATGTFHTPFSFSPDGKTLAYVSVHDGRTRLNLRRLDSYEVTPLDGTEGAEAPFFSPDGEWLGFYANNNLLKTSVRGGSPRVITNLQGLRGATWLDDDTIVLTTSTIDRLYTVPSSGGRPEPFTLVDSARGDTSHRFPRRIPGTSTILFGILLGADYQGSRIGTTVAGGGGSIRDLVAGAVDPRYSPTGHLLFVEQGSLMAIELDRATASTSGPKMTVLHDVMVQNNTGAAYFDVSGDGTLAYVAGGEVGGGFSLIWVTKAGEPTPAADRRGTMRWPRISRSGRRFTVSAYEQRRWNLWIGEVGSNRLNKVTYEGDDVGGVWTPDEKYVVFSSSRSGAWNLWRKRTDGSGQAERLASSPERQFATDVSPDGRYVVYGVKATATGNDVMLLDLEESNAVRPFLERPANDGGGRVSPDGNWATYASDETGRWEVFVTSFPGAVGRWQISSNGGRHPVWAHDGSRIFYREGNRMVEAELRTEPQVAVVRTRTLFVGWYEGLLGQADYASFDFSGDGERFLMLRSEGSSTRELKIVTGWEHDLDAL